MMQLQLFQDVPALPVEPLHTFHVSTVATVAPVVAIAPVVRKPQDNPLIARFRGWASGLDVKIEYASRSMTQNPTPKRTKEYQSRLHDARNMERLQKALRVLADAHADGSIPAALAELRTKDEIGRMVCKYVDGSKGGYYSVIESLDYADKSPAARVLQGMIEGNSAERAERERLRKLGELEAAVSLSKIPGFFPTPAAVVALMLDRANLRPGLRVLEPSAGSGNIADAVKAAEPSATVDAVEQHSKLRELLELKGYRLVGSDFLDADLKPYDRVIMNPPFERQQDLEHIRKAHSLLAPGGVLVSVASPSFEFRSDRKSKAFREWLGSVGAEVEPLPEGSFTSSGTGVNTRLVVIHA